MYTFRGNGSNIKVIDLPIDMFTNESKYILYYYCRIVSITFAHIHPSGRFDTNINYNIAMRYFLTQKNLLIF